MCSHFSLSYKADQVYLYPSIKMKTYIFHLATEDKVFLCLTV